MRRLEIRRGLDCGWFVLPMCGLIPGRRTGLQSIGIDARKERSVLRYVRCKLTGEVNRWRCRARM